MLSHRFVLGCLFILFTTNNLLAQTHSQDEIDKVIATLPPCPKPSDDKFEKLCEYLDTKDHRQITKLLRDMACIDDKDPALLKKAKMQRLISTYRADLYCSGEGFRQPQNKGDLLKYAVYRDYPAIIEHLVTQYQININYVPAGQKNQTLLDYVKTEIDAFLKTNNSDSKVIQLQSIYTQLRGFGAKHYTEL